MRSGKYNFLVDDADTGLYSALGPFLTPGALLSHIDGNDLYFSGIVDTTALGAGMRTLMGYLNTTTFLNSLISVTPNEIDMSSTDITLDAEDITLTADIMNLAADTYSIGINPFIPVNGVTHNGLSFGANVDPSSLSNTMNYRANAVNSSLQWDPDQTGSSITGDSLLSAANNSVGLNGGSVNRAYGNFSAAFMRNGSHADDVAGVYGFLLHEGTSTAAYSKGMIASLNASSSASIVNAYGFDVENISPSGSSSITYGTGYNVGNIATQNTAIGFHVSNNSLNAASEYGLYINDGQNYFSNGVRIGSDIANNQINSMSVGSGSNTLYIGNSTIDTTAPSDERTKDNIRDTSVSLRDLLSLRIVDFNYKQDIVNDNNQLHQGLLAQQVESIYPYAVETRSDGFKMVDYKKFIPLIMKSIQDIQTQINERALALIDGVQEIFVKKVTTEELCIEEVCITKNDLRRMLEEGAGNQSPLPLIPEPPANSSSSSSGSGTPSLPVSNSTTSGVE